MATQILNFGLPAQINVRTVGYDRANNLRVAHELRRRIAAIPGIADAHLQQETDAPDLYAPIDRTRAIELGLNATSIANNLNISLSSSEQVAPNFWTDPASGIPYYLAVQTPEPRVSSVNDLANTPVSSTLSQAGTPVPGMLSNVATLKRDSVPTNTNQSNIQPLYEVYARVQGRDLGGVAGANSILLVAFAREQQLAGWSALEAAITAGYTRIRPVLMTAAAMIVGMVPMALGGAGEEQNAALARAVIGGLLFATPTTLLIVPYLFAMLRSRNDGKAANGVFEELPNV